VSGARGEPSTCAVPTGTAGLLAGVAAGPPPALAQLPGLPGLTVAERDRYRDQLLAGLAERGLAEPALGGRGLGGRGLGESSRPVGWLAEQLSVLAGPGRRLDIRFSGPDGAPRFGLGAAAGAAGVVLLGTDGVEPVRLLACDATRVMSTLLGLLGPVRRGRGPSVNIAEDVLDRAIAAASVADDGNLWALSDELREWGVPAGQAHSLAQMCTGVQAGGQLGASAVFGGAQLRGDWVIGFHRGESGYFMNLRRAGTVTICPTDQGRLAQHWAELRDSLPS
jgi:EspG family